MCPISFGKDITLDKMIFQTKIMSVFFSYFSTKMSQLGTSTKQHSYLAMPNVISLIIF